MPRKRNEHTFINDTECKECNTCHKILPLDKYTTGKTADGLSNKCNECVSEYRRRKRNSSLKRGSYNKYLSDEERNIMLKIQWHNSAQRKIKSGKNAILRQNRRNKAKKIESSYTIEEWDECKKYFQFKCSYCGKNNTILTQEHFIPLNSGGEYTKNNIIPACRSCNSRKQDKNFFEWYPKQRYYSKEREEKILKYLNYNKKSKIQQLTLAI